jgi:dUTPase
MEDLNYMPKVKFVKVSENAKLPVKNHKSDTGFDVYATEDVTLPAKGSAVVPVGIKVGYIPP